MKKFAIVVAAIAAFGATDVALAQGANARDESELLISQIQADRRAVVLAALQLTDAQVAAFTPVYDKYQGEMKQVAMQAGDVINKFAANYGSMTDDAAKDIMKDFFKARDQRNAVMKKYAKQLQRALPATKVLQWLQVENKVNALLDVQVASVIPLAQ